MTPRISMTEERTDTTSFRAQIPAMAGHLVSSPAYLALLAAPVRNPVPRR